MEIKYEGQCPNCRTNVFFTDEDEIYASLGGYLEQFNKFYSFCPHCEMRILLEEN